MTDGGVTWRWLWWFDRAVVVLVLQDAGGQGVGFLLGSLKVCWALTSENCYKGLPKSSSGEVITFKGQSVPSL